MMPSIANITDQPSLCAPAVIAQISSGLAMVSRAARPLSWSSPCASQTTTALVTRNGTNADNCSQKTMSCMLRPPNRLASSCTQLITGPYTLGVSCQGRSVQRSTGSNWLRNTAAGVMSYGFMPSTCSRPYAAYINTSAEVSGGTISVATLSTTPKVKTRQTFGVQPSRTARTATARPTPPMITAANSTPETTHSPGVGTNPAGR
ncbi:hypothetical protein SDC9_106926 [bioreactor metagenome]|uniref:Uncharacterized protein n=1 Tax=bioreactor metagenome TaxID=1076179 RepID=A0A645B3S1_9ZZZZ